MLACSVAPLAGSGTGETLKDNYTRRSDRDAYADGGSIPPASILRSLALASRGQSFVWQALSRAKERSMPYVAQAELGECLGAK